MSGFVPCDRDLRCRKGGSSEKETAGCSGNAKPANGEFSAPAGLIRDTTRAACLTVINQ